MFSRARLRGVRQGFTMIELLIVVAILGLLMILVFMSVTRYLNQTRDAIRKTHLEKYRVILEDYFADHHRYPPASVFQNCGSGDLQPYMPTIYCDPLTKQPYTYETDAKGSYYNMYTKLAIVDDPTINEHGCGSGCGPGDNYNYGISDQQAVVGDSKNTTVPAICNYGGHYLCTAGVCGNCCPGNQYRCNSTGDGCYLDTVCSSH